MVTGLLALAGDRRRGRASSRWARRSDGTTTGTSTAGHRAALGLGRGSRTLSRTIPAVGVGRGGHGAHRRGSPPRRPLRADGRAGPVRARPGMGTEPGHRRGRLRGDGGARALGGRRDGPPDVAPPCEHGGQRRSRVSDRGAGGPAVQHAVGVRFALDPGRGSDRRARPVGDPRRGLAIGGVAAAVVFTSSLDRLGGTPERWGGRADFDLADADESEIEAVLDDERLSQISRSDVSEAVDVADQEEHVWSIDPLRGDLSWTVVEGRLPTGEDEVMSAPGSRGPGARPRRPGGRGRRRRAAQPHRGRDRHRADLGRRGARRRRARLP